MDSSQPETGALRTHLDACSPGWSVAIGMQSHRYFAHEAMMRVLIPLLLLACTGPQEDSPAEQKREEDQTQFVRDETVQITDPSNGAVVGDPFGVRFAVGDDVKGVRLFADGLFVDGMEEVSGTGRLVASLDSGSHKMTLVGLSESGIPVSEHSMTVQVVLDEEEPWVLITSPADDGTPTNPVRFTASASDHIDTIEFLADGWLLGEAVPGEVLSYSFSGTGFERDIEALAYDDGEVVASDTVSITVLDGTTPTDSDWNGHITDILATYPTDGTYQYYWPSSGDWAGNPHDIYYLSDLFAEGDVERRSYCVGLTLEVFMRAFDEIDLQSGGDGSINGIGFDELYSFRTDWYVRELYGAGIVDAMENYGIGERGTDWDDVQAGDIVQFWRHSGSGHNVIFVDWVTDSSGNRTGFEYWGTQGSTDGIGYTSESFGSSGSSVDPNFFFPGRLWMPEEWETW